MKDILLKLKNFIRDKSTDERCNLEAKCLYQGESTDEKDVTLKLRTVIKDKNTDERDAMFKFKTFIRNKSTDERYNLDNLEAQDFYQR